MNFPMHTIPTANGDKLCERVVLLENRVSNFGDGVDRVETKVDKIVTTLESLIRIEERQITINQRLADGAQTMQVHDSRIKALELAIPERLEDRLGTIEKAMPSLIEKAGWVTRILIGIATAVGAGVLGLLGIGVLK